jgi:hypothetical protein
MLCLYTLLFACIWYAPSTVAITIDHRSKPLREAEQNDPREFLEYDAEDQAAFDWDFASVWDDAHAQVVRKSAGQRFGKPGRINIVISVPGVVSIDDSSVVNRVLPYWVDSIVNGSWGTDLSLTVYVKTDQLDDAEHHNWLYYNATQRYSKTGDKEYHGEDWAWSEERMYSSNFGQDDVVVPYEEILIPNVGRNEHAFVWHMMRKAPSFADVEIFIKTNGAYDKKGGRSSVEDMIRYMVDVARNGNHGFVSYPWDLDRRYLLVRCDSAWSKHTLYEHLCNGDGTSRFPEHVKADGTKRNDIKKIYLNNYKYGRVPLHMLQANVMPLNGSIRTSTGSVDVPLTEKLPSETDLSWTLCQLPQPLPLVHETYGEGMFAVRREVLNILPKSWYTTLKNVTYKSNWGRETYDGFHHDGAMMEVLPLLFGQLEAGFVEQFPAWFVSPSTVDLFDTVDMTMKFNQADLSVVHWLDDERRKYERRKSQRRKSPP